MRGNSRQTFHSHTHTKPHVYSQAGNLSYRIRTRVLRLKIYIYIYIYTRPMWNVTWKTAIQNFCRHIHSTYEYIRFLVRFLPATHWWWRRLLINLITLNDTYTLGMAALDERSACRICVYLCATLIRDIHVQSRVEPAIPAGERPQTHAYRLTFMHKHFSQFYESCSSHTISSFTAMAELQLENYTPLTGLSNCSTVDDCKAQLKFEC